MSKSLYILTSDRGDGSRGVHFTLNAQQILDQEAAYEAGALDYDSVGVDGDGFNYRVIQVPDDATYKSLGINFPWDREAN